MNTRSILIGFFVLSAAIAMGAPARSGDADWVDRMAAASVSPSAAASTDWADRMAAARPASSSRVIAAREARESPDWIDRLVADRATDYPEMPGSRVQAALAEPR